ncbi:MAG TPA: hypothetical protein VN282_26950 [Pyrinomonadaceae bacterium]|nr:hypothetical protein [Pyrinomonadaceae bacterium]
MNRFTLLTLVALLTLTPAGADARAQQPTQASLINAWEQVQKDDPETVTFEKLGERSYRFKTNRFPFDGELKVLKATVSEPEYSDEVWASGVIEYDLVGLPEEVEKKYEHSFANWQATNMLYFDREGRNWLSYEEYAARLSAKSKEMLRTQQQRERQEQEKKQANVWLSLALTWAPLFGLVGFWAWLMKKTGLRNQRQYMNMATLHMQRSDEHMQRAEEHMRRSRELFERIAAAVESSGREKQ